MTQQLNTAIRVPFARVAGVALTLVLVPSFTLMARNGSSGSDVAATAPVGAGEAKADASVEHSTDNTAVAAAFALSGWEDADLGGIDPKVFALALGAASCAVRAGAATNPGTLTVIDYSRPSTAKRLWVYDVSERTLLYEELVAHGQGSGANLATLFSNEPDTHRTSIGLFVTDVTYVGRNGYSLRLDGLDKGFNDQARARAIVMHGAPYVNEAFAKAQGRIGRSWGCPALDDAIARKVIDRVKGGGLVFSYYPDQDWLKSSRFLRCG